MFRHVVLIKFVEGITEAQIEALKAGLSTLPGLIPQLKGYKYGTDIGHQPGNFDFAIFAELDSFEDYEIYRDDASHQALIASTIKPLIEVRAALQLPF